LGIALVAATAAPARAANAEADRVKRTILCDCGCSPQSVHDCACGRAAEMRAEIEALVREGRTGQQVIDAYVARHGEKILIAPTASGFSLLAWLGPVAALVGGAAIAGLVVRRWGRAAPAVAPPAAPPTVAADAVYLARLQRDLTERE
jgi:cytochrome c-type biogenesis protein CcmH